MTGDALNYVERRVPRPSLDLTYICDGQPDRIGQRLLAEPAFISQAAYVYPQCLAEPHGSQAARSRLGPPVTIVTINYAVALTELWGRLASIQALEGGQVQSDAFEVETISDHEAAERLGVSVRVLREIIDKRGLCLRIGRFRRLTQDHFRKLTAALQAEPRTTVTRPKSRHGHLGPSSIAALELLEALTQKKKAEKDKRRKLSRSP